MLLILSQHPTATRVAGFRAWLELGYCVTKGSTGIRIWAQCEPSRKRIQAWRDAGADPDQRPQPSYKLVSVFDRLSRVCPRHGFAVGVVKVVLLSCLGGWIFSLPSERPAVTFHLWSPLVAA